MSDIEIKHTPMKILKILVIWIIFIKCEKILSDRIFRSTEQIKRRSLTTKKWRTDLQAIVIRGRKYWLKK